ncbi:M23 family metallopeptidase [Sulfuriroseicoccus oceanibius]|uniref:M23 family metallopeptidase n=1 Tax=Sulfuriroseicoccus oceanibius TaxID=2707525 RepID=A0A6B3L928_9BACT|nr:M23 family metallopeptidase [Sulfuriroseicoccus oceanibius]QQL44326.1 M23 family metallopeptidase [Sulfuriroseicoccus oceanibius]
MNPKRFISGALAVVALIAALLPWGSAAAGSPMKLSLPTENTAIFSKEPWRFYMYTDRSFEGKKSKPWQGGTYGFSRNPKRTAEGLLYTKLHEGVDISPVRRDPSGTPTDAVRAISDGKVVHTNHQANHSNYGRYIVIEHRWTDGTYYSLYAHLQSIRVKPGQKVQRGTQIGVLGWTGRGINLTRAHLHLELNLMVHSDFERYHDRFLSGKNHHTIYNGINLVGVDVASLFKSARGNSKLTMAEFIRAAHPPHYRVAIPDGSKLEIVNRNPWISNGKKAQPGPWELTFSREGVPIAARPIQANITKPVVTWVKPSKTYHSYQTKGYLTGSGRTAGLSPSGLGFIALLTGDF